MAYAVWRAAAVRPALKKANGKDPRALNRAWVMVNLAHLGHLEHCTLVPSPADLNETVAKLVAAEKMKLTPRVVTYRSGRQEKLQVGSARRPGGSKP